MTSSAERRARGPLITCVAFSLLSWVLPTVLRWNGAFPFSTQKMFSADVASVLPLHEVQVVSVQESIIIDPILLSMPLDVPDAANHLRIAEKGLMWPDDPERSCRKVAARVAVRGLAPSGAQLRLVTQWFDVDRYFAHSDHRPVRTEIHATCTV